MSEVSPAEKTRDGRIEVESRLVPISEYGLEGSNYYLEPRNIPKGYTREDILAAGMAEDVLLDVEVASIIQSINEKLASFKPPLRLFIKEGYRSEELYEIVYQARIQKYIDEDGMDPVSAKERADKLFNMDADGKPHATGKSVDVSLQQFDPEKREWKELWLRDGEAGEDAYFIGFHQDALAKMDIDDPKRNDYATYQARQDFLAQLMCSHGFTFGSKMEYWHFDYTE